MSKSRSERLILVIFLFMHVFMCYICKIPFYCVSYIVRLHGSLYCYAFTALTKSKTNSTYGEIMFVNATTSFLFYIMYCLQAFCIQKFALDSIATRLCCVHTDGGKLCYFIVQVQDDVLYPALFTSACFITNVIVFACIYAKVTERLLYHGF